MLALFVDCLLLLIIIRRIVNTVEKNGDGDNIIPSFLIRYKLISCVDMLYRSTHFKFK